MLVKKIRRPITPVPIPTTAPLRFVPSLYQVAALAVLGAIFIIGLAPKIDTDLWWHLESATYIVSHLTVPRHDFLSFSFAGHSWIDHEWGSEVLLYGLYRIAGLWGTIIFFAGVICATYSLVYSQMVQRGVHPLLGLFVLTASFVAASETWGARPQMLTLFFLAAYALILFRYQVSRNRQLLWLFPALMLLWANLHGGWIIGAGFLGASIAGEWLNRLARHDTALSSGELRDLTVAFVATLAGSVANPNGFLEDADLLVFIRPNTWANAINEWASVDFHMPQMMAFEALLLTLIATVLVKRPRLNWAHLLLVVVFTHLALTQMRNVALWSVAISPLLAMYVQDLVALQRRATRSPRGAALNLLFLAAIVVVYFAEAAHYVNGSALQRNEQLAYPTRAVAYLRTHPLPPNVFNAYAWGGYLLWELYPKYRDFIDGRAQTTFDSRILRDYLVAYDAAPHWQSVLSRYHVEDVLVPPAAPLAQVLAADPAWSLVYHDRVAVVYTFRRTDREVAAIRR